MRRHAYNFTARFSLHETCELALVVLPLGLMIGSFVPLWYVARGLGYLLNIPSHAPVRDQPYGPLWLVLFLAAMVAHIVVAGLLGLFLVRWILRLAFGDRSDDPKRCEDFEPGEHPLYDPELDVIG